MSDLEDVQPSPIIPQPPGIAKAETLPSEPDMPEAQRVSTKQDILNRVRSTAEVITDPESPSLQEFHNFLSNTFKEGEVEPLDVFKEELSRNENENTNSAAHFICVVLRDPLHGAIVSCAYGSVQNGTIAIRFTLTESNLYLGKPNDNPINQGDNNNFINYRGTGISQEADKLLIEEAQSHTQKQGKDCDTIVAEAVERSESYWNKVEIEPENGLRRLYNPENGTQIHYRLPPLSWNPDGTPESDDVITENLQVAIKGHPSQIPVEKLKEVLKDWWAAWYIRPKAQFQDEAAWEKHKKIAEDILENEIIDPISQFEYLTLKSKADREQD